MWAHMWVRNTRSTQMWVQRTAVRRTEHRVEWSPRWAARSGRECSRRTSTGGTGRASRATASVTSATWALVQSAQCSRRRFLIHWRLHLHLHLNLSLHLRLKLRLRMRRAARRAVRRSREASGRRGDRRRARGSQPCVPHVFDRSTCSKPITVQYSSIRQLYSYISRVRGKVNFLNTTNVELSACTYFTVQYTVQFI